MSDARNEPANQDSRHELLEALLALRDGDIYAVYEADVRATSPEDVAELLRVLMNREWRDESDEQCLAFAMSLVAHCAMRLLLEHSNLNEVTMCSADVDVLRRVRGKRAPMSIISVDDVLFSNAGTPLTMRRARGYLHRRLDAELMNWRSQLREGALALIEREAEKQKHWEENGGEGQSPYLVSQSARDYWAELAHEDKPQTN